MRAVARTLAVVALLGVTALPRTTEAERPAPSAFDQKKADALLRDRLPCLGCHALGDEGGRLAPDLRTVRDRRPPSRIAAMIDDPERVVPGTIMPRVALSDATRDLLVWTLAGENVARVSPAPADAGTATTPREVYAKRCAPCHGERGRGDGPNASRLPIRPTDHTNADILRHRTDDALFDTISAGGSAMNRSVRMPGFEHSLSRQEIRGLVRYLRELCRCEGPAWGSHESAGP